MGRNQDAPAVGDEVTLLVVVQHHPPPQLRVAALAVASRPFPGLERAANLCISGRAVTALADHFLTRTVQLDCAAFCAGCPAGSGRRRR